MAEPERFEIRRVVRRLRSEGADTSTIAAVLRHEHQVNGVAAERYARGWSQEHAHNESRRRWPDNPIPTKAFTGWETWLRKAIVAQREGTRPPTNSRRPNLDSLERLAQLYECSASDLLAGWAAFGATHDETLTADRYPFGVDRRRALKALGVVGLAATGVARHREEGDGSRLGDSNASVLDAVETARAVARHDPPGDQITMLQEAVASLERSDAALGGGALRQVAVNLYDQASNLLANGPGSPETQRVLRNMTVDLAAWVGWLSFDSGNFRLADRYLNQAMVLARMNDDTASEIRAMSYLCLVLTRTDQHRFSLQCADAAIRLSKSISAPPQVRAILHMRSALSHAALGDRAAFSRSVIDANTTLETGGHRSAAPSWARFVDGRELLALTGCGLLRLGDFTQAVEVLEPVAADLEPNFRRNAIYYRARVAEATAAIGDVSEASRLALSLLPAAATVQSQRVSDVLATLRKRADRHTDTVPAARDFAEAYDDSSGGQ